MPDPKYFDVRRTAGHPVVYRCRLCPWSFSRPGSREQHMPILSGHLALHDVGATADAVRAELMEAS